jgi:hypothetical protein
MNKIFSLLNRTLCSARALTFWRDVAVLFGWAISELYPEAVSVGHPARNVCSRAGQLREFELRSASIMRRDARETRGMGRSTTLVPIPVRTPGNC